MNHNNVFRRSVAAGLAATALVTAAGCGTHPGDALAHAEQVAASCPSNGGRIAALMESDESGSRRGATGQPTQQQVIRGVAERAAICGGHLRVVIFAGSMIDVTVFDGDLQLDGATATARLRKAPEAVDTVMTQISTALPDASTQLTDGATDIVGQYQLAAEYQAQLSMTANSQMELTMLTDGIQTAGQDLGDPALTAEQAEALATTFTVPKLPGAAVRIIGIGRQADDTPLPTPYIAALRAFHTAVCKRSQATCTVVTDAAGA